MSISLEDQKICAWYESQTEQTLCDLQDHFGAESPREAFNAFFTPSAEQSPGDSLAVPAEALQGECILPASIPVSETLWLFLTGGYGYAYVSSLDDCADKCALVARAHRNWDQIRSELIA